MHILGKDIQLIVGRAGMKYNRWNFLMRGKVIIVIIVMIVMTIMM